MAIYKVKIDEVMMQFLEDLGGLKDDEGGLENRHHNVKGYAYRDVKVRRLNSSAIEEMKLYEFDRICGKTEQLQIFFPLFVFSSWRTQWRGEK